jgi:hypothetical protein
MPHGLPGMSDSRSIGTRRQCDERLAYSRSDSCAGMMRLILYTFFNGDHFNGKQSPILNHGTIAK